MTQLDVRHRPRPGRDDARHDTNQHTVRTTRHEARQQARGDIRVDADGAPVWCRSEGQSLVPGVAAWRRLGVGLRCETWLGWSRSGWHPVVVKLTRPHQVREPRAWAALLREVYVLTRARHPALPVLYADHVAADCPYVVMEYVEALDLADELDENGPLDAVSAARLATQLLSALAVVHATGAAHLDVKPENVLIRNGHPVLVDFGSARPIGSPQPPGRPLGTPGYAAPEMEACRPISPSMDVFGVGTVLAEAVGGPRRRDPARRAVSTAAERLTTPDPRARPDIAEAVAMLGAAVGSDQLWPAFVRSAAERVGPPAGGLVPKTD